MGLVTAYRLRMKRRRFLLRAFRRRRDLRQVVNRTAAIRPDDILLVSTLHDEGPRLRHFLRYYRDLGVNHFLLVDNGSSDNTAALLSDQPDVSLWQTDASYRRARYGIDWVNHLLRRHGHGHWTLTVDADELFVFPFCDTRPLRAMTDWLDASGIRSFGAMLLDMYPKGPLEAEPCADGQNPLEIACWFDSGNYMIRRHHEYGNLWIQGGPRARVFFAADPQAAPALNKVPLVRWHRSYAYASSTHALLPRGLNNVFDERGGEKASGCLLHTKFINTFPDKVAAEMTRRQHFAGSREYLAYARARPAPELWCKWSEKYLNWRQLEILGLMSKGNWA